VTSFARFSELAADGGRLVPVWRTCLLDTDTPVSAFAKLRRGPFAFLLESAPAGSETWSRYTYLGTEPSAAWRLTGQAVERWTAGSGWEAPHTVADPIADLQRLLTEYEAADVPELGGFWGGAVGFFGYDVVRLLERLPDAPPRGTRCPTRCSCSRARWW
jgi:anthranilate synthase component 1